LKCDESLRDADGSRCFHIGRLNQRAQKFGFIRYYEISNPNVFQKQLENIWIREHEDLRE